MASDPSGQVLRKLTHRRPLQKRVEANALGEQIGPVLHELSRKLQV